jgi:hypothetical protein
VLLARPSFKARELSTMAKRTITKMWIWGVAVMTVGGLSVTASSLAFAFHAKNLPPGETDGLFWTTVALIVASSVIGGVGLILQEVAWIGAVFNARRLTDRTWFRVLLVGGLVGGIIALVTLPIAVAVRSGIVLWVGYPVGGLIGWAVMIPYLVAGPDRIPVEQQQVALAGAPRTIAAAS